MRATFIAALMTLVVLPGCTTGASPSNPLAPLGQPIVMAPGQQIMLADGVTLRYLKVEADSRCPPGVQCIWAGVADVVFEFNDKQKASHRVTVNTAPPATAAIGKWQLRVLALAFGAAPKATVQIDTAPGR